MNALKKLSIAIVLLASLLAGCGGGGTSTTTASTTTGKFIDATVVGMAYRCGSSTTTTGTTNANGEYTCPAGQGVAFYVGDILIGSVTSSMSIVTPLDLVGAGATPSNATVANIVRFFMSISSTDPSTGTITITPAVNTAATGQAVNFASTSAGALDTLITTVKPGATVYTSAQATAHVSSSVYGLFAGNWSGTFTGTFGGTWSISINNAGVVTGTATDTTAGIGAVTGNIGTTLSTGSTYVFSGSAGGTPWTGTLNVSTKVFSGTWNDGQGQSGTFTGAFRN